MEQFWIIAVALVIFGTAADLTIPPNLSIGTSSASYEIEGAWNVTGKGLGLWDDFTHNSSSYFVDGSNEDIGADSYHKYEDDVALMKSVELKFYRFAISWARVLPSGFANVINEEGLQYYKNLTAELVKNGIEPMATLHHLDHPVLLEEFGGWMNEMMIDLFTDYAGIMFEALGDHVKVWMTINEPNMLCKYGYDNGAATLPPALKAHASVYHMYDKEFRSTQKGEIGISGMCLDFIPANSTDTTSADIAFQFQCGWIFHLLYKGDYPEIMKTRIARISSAQGYPRSRLPEFSDKWISYTSSEYSTSYENASLQKCASAFATFYRGPTDYFGLNFYTSILIGPDPNEDLGTYVGNDEGMIMSVDPSWPTSKINSYSVTPSGLTDFLVLVNKEYDNPPVRILENGYSDEGAIEDYRRIDFHYKYLEALFTAIRQYSCDVRSNSIWSFLDSFELFSGYEVKFGIVSVDFNDPNRTRTEKLSASWWRSVMESGKLQPVPCNDTSCI